MSNCIICIEPCDDNMKCCQASIHVGCLQDTIEKGFNKCPHCQKEIYKSPTVLPVAVPIIRQEPAHSCSRITCEAATIIFLLYGFSFLTAAFTKT